ncbi:response regulator transcription factor [Thiosulfativibrio zosterae]|uniref:HTH luxR-type domain-containing protein n=1 Tax=Thiosulfativibrio zosterae TaxID=2675053 RepID=A0A6F8PQD1_9GAMM|nr:response regulator transcription factor [Thiosulfativibrio zosterae]BBP44244.1 hypothetical protein THMIRHAT_19900 [Thiosulfativibrio zosterae]
MKKLPLFTLDSNLIKHWQAQLADTDYALAVFDNLTNMSNRLEQTSFPQHAVCLIHLDNFTDVALLKTLCAKFTLLILSNAPSNAEAIPLFKLGIKGYLNAFANQARILQVLFTLEAGSVWLGQQLLSELIQTGGLIEPEANLASEMLDESILTEREQQTLDLIRQGLSNAEIAQTLEITERTVKKHVNQLLEKCQVKDRLALVIKYPKRQ